jgi:hypothetical protein
MSLATWELVSSSGRESARWTVVRENRAANEPVLFCDVALAGNYFGEPLSVDTVRPGRDFTLEMHGLAVPISTLIRLLTIMRTWLTLSLSELRSSNLALDCEMGGLFDQRVALVIGDRADTISSGHPVATMKYVVGRMKGELSFVTDQSCLASFCRGIDAAVCPSKNRS